MLAGVFVGNDPCADRMQPIVSAGMIEVPMGIDQVRDGFIAYARERFSELRARHADACIYKQLPVRTGENSDIATRAFEDGDIAAQRVGRYRRGRCTIFDKGD